MRRRDSESGKGLPPRGGRLPPERHLRHDVYEGTLSRLTEVCLRSVRLRCVWRGRLRLLLHRPLDLRVLRQVGTLQLRQLGLQDVHDRLWCAASRGIGRLILGRCVGRTQSKFCHCVVVSAYAVLSEDM
jgi:hypothetical protein